MGRRKALHSRKSTAKRPTCKVSSHSQTPSATPSPANSHTHTVGNTPAAASPAPPHARRKGDGRQTTDNGVPHKLDHGGHEGAPKEPAASAPEEGETLQRLSRKHDEDLGIVPDTARVWTIPANTPLSRQKVVLSTRKGDVPSKALATEVPVPVGHAAEESEASSDLSLDEDAPGNALLGSSVDASPDTEKSTLDGGPLRSSVRNQQLPGCRLRGCQRNSTDTQQCRHPERADGKAVTMAKGCLVCVRVRPESVQEISSGGSICVSTQQTGDGSMTLLLTGLREQQYSFRYDFVFDQDATQENVYCCTCLPLVDKLLAGYSASVIAYGQTGAGKSYTMVGDCSSEDFHRGLTDPATRGVIPRIIEALVRRTQTLSRQNSDTVFSIRGSLIEIYNETVRDLLAPGRDHLVIRESTPSTVITDATEVPISSVAQALEVIKAGFANRALGTTLSNDKSSRSHAILQITIQRDSLLECTTKSSQLFLVDLAGSERVSKADTTGERLREAQNINRSLLALGNVISAVPPTGGPRKHIPYRESKLTRLLQHSLGGNSFTVVLLCCSPHSFNVRETLSTLRFGDRAAHLHNKPQSTETLSPALLQKRLVESQTELRFSQARLRACVTQSARQIEAIKMLQKYIPEGVQLSDEDMTLLRKALEGCTPLDSVLGSPASAASPKKLLAIPKNKPKMPPVSPWKAVTTVNQGSPPTPPRKSAAQPGVVSNRPTESATSGQMWCSDNAGSLAPGSDMRLTSEPFSNTAFNVAPSLQAGQHVATGQNSAPPKEKHVLKASKQQRPHSSATGVPALSRQPSPEAVPQLPPKQRPAESPADAVGHNSDGKATNQDPAGTPHKTPDAERIRTAEAGMFDRVRVVRYSFVRCRRLNPTTGPLLKCPLL